MTTRDVEERIEAHAAGRAERLFGDLGMLQQDRWGTNGHATMAL